MENYSSEEESIAPNEDLRALPANKRCDQVLSLEIGYPPGWNFRDSFREVCQNWSDGMRITNHLTDRYFNTEIRDERFHWVARALHPDTGRLLGFIKFFKKKGTIEVTNFDAQLHRRSLNFGAGDKSSNPHLAGGKGEGYKAAAAVALAEGYQYRYEASSCYWKFHIGGKNDPEQIYCELKPMRQNALANVIASYDREVITASSRNEEKSYIHKDVTVKIGKVYQSKVFPGVSITEEVFLECIKVSLDLVPPTDIVKTDFGYLILDDEFKDTTYLKHLLVEGNSGISKYKFGYHFRQGSVDRDRRRRPNQTNDASRMANIWRCVINEHPRYLQNYIEMMEDEASHWADVYLADRYVSVGIAKQIAQHYFGLAEQHNIFYYDSRNGDKGVEIITRSLKKKPKKLISVIWDILRRRRLVRTPQEHQEHLLRNAPEVGDNGSPYSSSVKRALMAALLLSPRTNGLGVSFRAGANVGLDLLLSGKVLNINDVWLDFNASHKKVPCSLSNRTTAGADNGRCFSCHHVIVELHRLIMEELDRHRNDSDNSTDQYHMLNQRVRENLSQMPVMVAAQPTAKGNEISVSWEDLDIVSRLHELNARYRVTLHRESTCSGVKQQLLTRQESEIREGSGQYIAACGCPEIIEVTGKVMFTGLDPNEHYFPMIARTDPQSFFGISLKAVQPNLLPVPKLNEKVMSAPPPIGPSSISASASYISSGAGDVSQPQLGPRTPQTVTISNLNNPSFSSADSGRSPSPSTAVDTDQHEISAADQQQLERYKSEVEKLRLEIAEKDESLRHMRTKIQELQAKLHTANELQDQYKQKITEVNLQNSRDESGSTEVLRQLKEAHDITAAEAGNLRATLEQVRADLRNRESDLQAAKTLISDLQAREAEANDTIGELQSKIRELHITNKKLENDLDMAHEVHDKQNRLAASRLERMRISALSMLSEDDQGVEDKAELERPRKRAKQDDTCPEDSIVID